MAIFGLADGDSFGLADGDDWLLAEGVVAGEAVLRPGAVVQREDWLRQASFAQSAPSLSGAHISRSGVRIERPQAADTVQKARLRSGGHDVTRLMKDGSLRITKRVGEPWKAQYKLIIDPADEDVDLMLRTEGGVQLTTEGGVTITAEGDGSAEPGLGEFIRIGTSYRDVVAALEPDVYWPLDAVEPEARDSGETGRNRGVVNPARAAAAEPPVPYGSAMTLTDSASPGAVRGPMAASQNRSSLAFFLRSNSDTETSTPVMAANIRVRLAGGYLAVTAGAGAAESGGAAFPAGTWRHVAVTVNGTVLLVYIDGALAETHTAIPLGSGRMACGFSTGPAGVDVDEVAWWGGRVLDASEIAAASAARASSRLFAGICSQRSVKGLPPATEGGSSVVEMSITAVGLGEAFKSARVKPEFSTDGSKTVRQVMQEILDAELPDQPITADGVAIDEIVNAVTGENFGTVHQAFTWLAESHGFSWHVDPTGTIVAHKLGAEPVSAIVLDEDENLAVQTREYTEDLRLFRTQQFAGSEGGRAETDVFTGDGDTRFWRLTHDADFSQGVTVSVDGVPKSVDAAGSFEFDADFFGDAGENLVGVPGSKPVPGEGAMIEVRYRSLRRQLLSAADIDAIKRYGLRSSVAFDNSLNDYDRMEAHAAAFLVGNSSPTRVTPAVTRRGSTPALDVGVRYRLNAANAYGMVGGSAWLAAEVTITTDRAGRITNSVMLQQGPYQPFTADYYERLKAASERLPGEGS